VQTPLQLQLFVTAPQPKAKRPYYKRDVLNLCCMSVGSRLSLAYSESWLSKRVMEEAQRVSGKDSAGSAQLSQAIVIFCEEQSPVVLPSIYRFFPIRRATLVRIDRGLNVYTFELKLGEFFDYDDAEAGALHNAIVDQDPKDHPNYPRVDGKPHPDAKLVRVKPDQLSLMSKPDAWDRLVQRFAELNGLNDAIFFVPIDRSSQAHPVALLKTESAVSSLRSEAKVHRSDRVPLDFYAVRGKRADFQPPKVAISEPIASVSGPFIRQYMSGYFVHYELVLRPGWDSDASMLRVAVPEGEDAGCAFFRSPDFSLHLRISTRLGLLALVIGLLVGGAVLVTLDISFLSRLFRARPEDSGPWITLAFSKAIGSVFSALGLFLAFRKLPIR